jgi:hypothetical protein
MKVREATRNLEAHGCERSARGAENESLVAAAA